MALESKTRHAAVLRLLAFLAAPLTLPASGAASASTISGYADVTAANSRVSIDGAPASAHVLILGANLGTSGTVAFNGIPAQTVLNWAPTEIVAVVPPAPSYPFKGPITVTTGGQTVQGPDFTILPPSPAPPALGPPPAGTWSVISLPQKPGEVIGPRALAANATGDLYVADQSNGSRFQKRDTRGNWSVIATGDAEPLESHTALATDTAGNLYVAGSGRIQERDAQGTWSVIANFDGALAADNAGKLYVTDYSDRIQERDVNGN